jgi:prepilin-type N-terminal cleavage/methylation domain-containing protein
MQRTIERHAFSLVELLVVITIILMLMALMGAAVSAARNTNKQRATRALIGRLDAVMRSQAATYADRQVAPNDTAAVRAAKLRKILSADMPDRWIDVEYMAKDSGRFSAPRQQAYIGFWNSLPSPPSPAYAGAECLFMILMIGGISDCLDCSDLAKHSIGDKDRDGALEFHDAWGNPIGYILWPGALRLPTDAPEALFSKSAAFTPDAVEPTIRFLIYSGGPDGVDVLDDKTAEGVSDSEEKKKDKARQDLGQFGFRCDVKKNPDDAKLSGYLEPSIDCGNPTVYPGNLFGRPFDGAEDNITNLDSEFK